MITVDQAQKIRLLSDGKLYRDAVDLVQKHDREHDLTKISNSQLSGLWNAVGACDWGEIFRYTENRLNRNTISDELKEFYQDLNKYLNGLLDQVEETNLVVNPETMNRTQRREKRRQYAYFLAREFIQHLVAECNYKRSLQNA